MKNRITIVITVLLSILLLVSMPLPVLAESSVAVADESGSGDSFENPPMKEYTWVYILIAVVTVICIIASAIIITKKVK